MFARLRILAGVAAAVGALIVATPTPASASVGRSLFQNANSYKCLEIVNYYTHNFAAAVQYDCHGGANQQWHLNGSNGLIANQFSGKCLEVYGYSKSNFGRVA